MPTPDALAQALRPELLTVFPPALLGRLIVLPYLPLAEPVLRDIVRLQLDRIVRRVADNHGARLEYDETVVDLIVSRCQEVASGGRMIDAILTNSMLPDLSAAVLERQIRGKRLPAIGVGSDGQGFTYSYIEAEEPAPAELEAAE
jgi:type VI secretion system protein VasG